MAYALMCLTHFTSAWTVYDRQKYYDITLPAAESLLRPFGYDREVLDDVVAGSTQMRVEDFVK